MADYSKVLELEPHFLTYFNRANTNILLDKLNDFDSSLALNPNYFLSHFSKGIVFEKQNKLKDALECYKTAYKINPESELVLQKLAIFEQMINNTN